MSPLESTKGRGVVTQTPKADLVTTLLAISLVAIIIAIVCLLMELARYDDISPQSVQLSAAAQPPAVAQWADAIEHVRA